MNLEGVNVTNLIEYFVEGHTGKGYVNYLQSNLQNINRIILLQHTDPRFITRVLGKVMETSDAKVIEIIRSIENKHIIEGIILHEQSLALLNKRIYHTHQDDKSISTVPLQQNVKHHNYQQRYSSKSFTNAYNSFKRGLALHEKLEQIYISEMDFEKADFIINKLLSSLFSNVKKQAHNAVIYERLFGTNTPEGIVNTLENLIEAIGQRIFILGRAGTGKSYLMNKVLDECKRYGLDVEVYRCSLDPDSIDMLIIRSLNVCLHDNTAPHVIATPKDNVQIIDMYKGTVDQKVEKNKQEKISMLKVEYKEAMQLGLAYLKNTEITDKLLDRQHNEQNINEAVNKLIKIIQH